MPIYEYKCSNCGYEFEVEQSIKNKPLKKCSSCKKNMLERLISTTSFSLKGDCWAKDLYSSKNKSTNNRTS
jgi:putative FmdB family regulatory protein